MNSDGPMTRIRRLAWAGVSLGLVLAFASPSHSRVNDATLLADASAGRSFVVTADTPAPSISPVRLRFAGSITSQIVASQATEVVIQASFFGAGQTLHAQVIQAGSVLAHIDAAADAHGTAIGIAQVPSERISRNQPIVFRVSFSGDHFEVHDRVEITAVLRAAVLPA